MVMMEIEQAAAGEAAYGGTGMQRRAGGSFTCRVINLQGSVGIATLYLGRRISANSAPALLLYR